MQFTFIIPLTPKSFLHKEREILLNLCLRTLKKQNYSNWSALLIGGFIPEESKDDRHFIHINYEGKKEEKLQKATEYIKQNNIKSDYIIRLDDDDIINPNILSKVKYLDFDLYVDKTQFFWYHETKQIASRTWYWYPNTCIHKTEHALVEFGDFAKGDFKKFHEKALLIENDHSKLHTYYKNKRVLFSKMNNPVYLRSITNTSITASNSSNYIDYVNRFGNWQTNKLKSFKFLGTSDKKINQSLIQRLRNIKIEFRSRLDYIKHINEYN